jgi:hypothetical protein
MLVPDIGYVRGLIAFPVFPFGAGGKEAKQSRPKARHWSQRAKKNLRSVSPLILRGWHRPIGWRRGAAQSTR